MGIHSEKFGKFLFFLEIEGIKYCFVWGTLPENHDAFILIDESNKILLFENLDKLKKYIITAPLEDLKDWINGFDKEDEKLRIISLSSLQRIKNNITLDNHTLWNDISLFIELCTDLAYISKDDNLFEILDREAINHYNDTYMTHFIWQDQDKKDFEVTDDFIKAITDLLAAFNKSVLIK